MARKPLTVNAGRLEQLPDGAGLDVGSWDLPAAGGTVLFVLMADGSGNATWAQVDHGDTTGRSDDDHTLYHTDARGDARYYTETELDAGQLDNRYFTEAEHLDSSTGAGDSGKPIKLDAGGHVDATMLNDSDIDHGAISGLSGDHHSHYSLVDGTRPFTGTVGGVSPTEHSHLVTKEYVDAVIQVLQPYFLLDAAHADIASTKNTQVFDPELSIADVTTVGVVDDQVLQAWASPTAESSTRDIPAGVFTFHIHAEKTLGARDLQFYFKIFEVDSGLSETLIMTSEISAEVTSETHVSIHATLSSPHAILAGSWVLIRVYATVTGSGNAPTAVIYYQGLTSARFDIPTPSMSIDHGTLLGLLDDDHGGYHTDARANTWLANGHETTYAHANYDTAYGWGNHAGLYDPSGTMTTHESTYNHTNYDTAYGWGDHAGVYDTTGTAAAAVSSHESTYNHANYDTAYGWGDHASGGYLKADGSVALTAHWAAGAFNITGLALLTVDSITINGATITSDTGALSFVDENISTTGTVVGSNIPAPTADNQVLISTAADAASWNTAGNNQFLSSDSSGGVSWEDKTGDAPLWIATTGNDSTGDGTEGDPYATIGKCITEFQSMSFDPGDTATINLEDGEYTSNYIVLPKMVPLLKLLARAAYSFTMSATVSQVNVAGDVYDVQITLDTTTNISASNFITIEECTSLPEINGCWEVQSVDDGTHITIRITHTRAVPSIGAYAATVYAPRAHVARTGGTLFGVYTRLNVTGLIINGTVGSGIQLYPYSELTVEGHTGFSGWGYGIYSVMSSVAIINGAISNCIQGVYLVNISTCTAVYWGCSGCSTGFYVDRLSHLYAQGCFAASCTYGLLVQYGSSAKVYTTIFINSYKGAQAENGSFIRLAGCTDTNNDTYISPVADTQGNKNSWITL